MEKLGYYEIKTISIQRFPCMLTIGSIIKFNGKKCIVTHTDTSGNRQYDKSGKWPKDITKGYSGYLRDIETYKEFRANWSTVTKNEILYYEDFKS